MTQHATLSQLHAHIWQGRGLRADWTHVPSIEARDSDAQRERMLNTSCHYATALGLSFWHHTSGSQMLGKHGWVVAAVLGEWEHSLFLVNHKIQEWQWHFRLTHDLGRVRLNFSWLGSLILKQGFGNIDGEYWLGLENIYWLTNQGTYKLLVTLEDWTGRKTFAEYASFRIESEVESYRLRVGHYHGNAGDSFTWHNSKQFTTLDKDNDVYTGGFQRSG